MGCRAALTLPLSVCIALAGACSRDKPPSEETTVRFNKVPLLVDIPAGWRRSRNDPQWLAYRAEAGGAFVAMTGEPSCDLVEKRLTTALLELGVSEVVWKTPPRDTHINGLRATVASGVAKESEHPARLQYALVQADKRQGCLLTVAAVWQSEDGPLGATTDGILRSIRTED